MVHLRTKYGEAGYVRNLTIFFSPRKCIDSLHSAEINLKIWEKSEQKNYFVFAVMLET